MAHGRVAYAGLRIDRKPIPGLWCGGESAGGCSQRGLGQRLAALKA